MSSPSKRSAGSYRSLPSKRLRRLQCYQKPSLNLPTADDLTAPLTEVSDLLASFTPDASKKLLKKLLDDPDLRPGVTAHIHALLAEAFPASISSIRARVDRATAHMREPEDHRAKKMTCSGHYVKACAPFLRDVVGVARMPVPGAARDALALLRDIHGDSIPDLENVDDGVEERAEFDEATDGLMVALLKRMREEGDKEASNKKWLKNLREELLEAVKDSQENFDMPENLFSGTIGLLEEWLGMGVPRTSEGEASSA
ncbi:hypothetical protein C8T65DRAFT_241658 [Cerioporus squamosus]|nr:hypothetical protein C8T65DRAFT_241658 [Cerioporus squamosus]